MSIRHLESPHAARKISHLDEDLAKWRALFDVVTSYAVIPDEFVARVRAAHNVFGFGDEPRRSTLGQTLEIMEATGRDYGVGT